MKKTLNKKGMEAGNLSFVSSNGLLWKISLLSIVWIFLAALPARAQFVTIEEPENRLPSTVYMEENGTFAMQLQSEEETILYLDPLPDDDTGTGGAVGSPVTDAWFVMLLAVLAYGILIRHRHGRTDKYT